jgi:MFS family permease
MYNNFVRYGDVIYKRIYEEDAKFTSEMTQNIIALLDPLSQLVSVILIPRVGRRTLILLSALTVGIINIMIGVFELTDINLGAFIMFMALVFFTSIAQEPCCFLYILETSPNSIYGVVMFIGNAITIILGYV